MKNQKSRNENICLLAEDISYSYFPNSKVIPFEIAIKHNISYSYERHPDDFDGLLLYHRDFHIELNLRRLKESNSHRARFTFCHELGHYFIDEHRESLLTGGSLYHISKSEYESDLPVEKEADLFASYLLMPRERFIQLAKKIKIGFEGILLLSQTFGTSITSTSIRYVQAELKPCMIFKWSNEGRLDWKYGSHQFETANFGKSFSKGELFNRRIKDSSTDKALMGKLPTNGKFFQIGSTVNSWFPYVFDSKNDILIEESFPIGEFGVLTLIYTDNSSFNSSTKF